MPDRFERLVDDGQDPLDVRPRGDLRHDAAEAAVQLVLGGHDAAENLQGVGDDRRGRFVAGGLQEEEVRNAECGMRSGGR